MGTSVCTLQADTDASDNLEGVRWGRKEEGRDERGEGEVRGGQAEEKGMEKTVHLAVYSHLLSANSTKSDFLAISVISPPWF